MQRREEKQEVRGGENGSRSFFQVLRKEEEERERGKLRDRLGRCAAIENIILQSGLPLVITI